ncbi:MULTISPECIES: MarR family winged helix-turn-helix transcriptional regulator [Paenibacillus]|uniref:MarR family winged helix-turn-helix transcriptional regulator n=1 Tax=Paenibacillus TaxID=44249 RepID=UPI0022B8DACA|nr:MarR family transcriptional regulator [Paenibacillus caseinilyticus]MCZ8518312.1 MarR family transcriptional regulator [Paenibacillus caseinilyticus]
MDVYRELFLMQQTYATLFSLANKIQIKGDAYLENLTSRQYMTMVAIAHLQPDETTLNNISRKLGTTKQSIKQIIDILEKKGYLLITPSPKDKRAVNVRITVSGQQVMVDAAEKGIYFFADLFSDFSTAELEQLWNLLKKMYRFDGEEQDGFEEEGNLEPVDNQDEIKARVLKEFERRRQQSKGGAGQ